MGWKVDGMTWPKNEISPNIHLCGEDLASHWNEMSLFLVEADRCCDNLRLLWFVRTIASMYAVFFTKIVVICFLVMYAADMCMRQPFRNTSLHVVV